MREKCTFSSLPSFLLHKSYNLPDEKQKKEKKNETKKTSNPRTFVEFPAISILFYHVALAE